MMWDPEREYRSIVQDNLRWQRYVHRPGDIVVCTPAKNGTTWMQAIVTTLLFPDGAPGPVFEVSPLIDARFEPIEEVTGRLEDLLREAFPEAGEIAVVDRTGGGDHFQVTVASGRFADLSLVEQHRLVYDALAAPLADGTIHELRIKTRGDQ